LCGLCLHNAFPLCGCSWHVQGSATIAGCRRREAAAAVMAGGGGSTFDCLFHHANILPVATVTPGSCHEGHMRAEVQNFTKRVDVVFCERSCGAGHC